MERGTYGKTVIGADNTRGASVGKWIVGAVVLGGAVLWAQHQSDQIKKLYSATDLPHQSFLEDLRARSSTLAGATRSGVHSFRQFLGTRKVT
jgi:hypothetical protein